MILDCHIHIMDQQKDRKEFTDRIRSAGIAGGVLFSMPPASFTRVGKKFGQPHTTSERLDDLFYWIGDDSNLFPFYWIDPMEEDAREQVETAEEYGVKGYKIICNYFYPGDSRALEILQYIADKKKPVIFHSGILFDGAVSSKYNRPLEFEALIEVKGLKFAMAHVSWPWCDECIALYGKFMDARYSDPDLNTEMFYDITPGTPHMYREDVLTKLLKLYDAENNILFGTDSLANNLSCEYSQEIIERDSGILKKLGVGKDIEEKIFFRNLQRFTGA